MHTYGRSTMYHGSYSSTVTHGDSTPLKPRRLRHGDAIHDDTHAHFSREKKK
jgi:hypothetical protein